MHNNLAGNLFPQLMFWTTFHLDFNVFSQKFVISPTLNQVYPLECIKSTIPFDKYFFFSNFFIKAYFVYSLFNLIHIIVYFLYRLQILIRCCKSTIPFQIMRTVFTIVNNILSFTRWCLFLRIYNKQFRRIFPLIQSWCMKFLNFFIAYRIPNFHIHKYSLCCSFCFGIFLNLFLISMNIVSIRTSVVLVIIWLLRTFASRKSFARSLKLVFVSNWIPISSAVSNTGSTSSKSEIASWTVRYVSLKRPTIFCCSVLFYIWRLIPNTRNHSINILGVSPQMGW